MIIDWDALENEDHCYALKLFHEILSNYTQCKENVPEFYYQYEFDSQKTTYEWLMDTHYIAISAHSYGEAMILNFLLRFIIDGQCGSLTLYQDDYDNDTTTDQFVNFISNQTDLNQWNDYKSQVPKSVKIQYFSKMCKKLGFEIKKKKYYVFTLENVLKLLNDQHFIENFNNTQYRLKKIFDIFVEPNNKTPKYQYED